MPVFRFDPAPEFSADVHITVPGQDGAAVVRLRFKHLGRAALDAWVSRPTREGVSDDAAYLGEVVCGWEGMQDSEGREVLYGQANLAALLDSYPTAGREIFSAYVTALTESRAKN